MNSLSSQHQKLIWLISEADKFGVDQIELRAHWARYLCVLASGCLKNALRDIYGRYVRSRSDPAIANYVERALNRIQNPKATRFVETASAFNKEWEESLGDFLELDGKKEAIDAIISNRHRIAHGQDSTITLAQVRDYLAKSEEVVEFIEGQCGLRGER